MDGCSPFRIYWKIMLPLSLPVLATAAIFSFIWTWDDFFGPLIYLNDINTYTVQLGLRSFVDSTGRLGLDLAFRHVQPVTGAGLPVLPVLPEAADRRHRHHGHETLNGTEIGNAF